MALIQCKDLGVHLKRLTLLRRIAQNLYKLAYVYVFIRCRIISLNMSPQNGGSFEQTRMMLEKERSSGMYRLSSYFMARTLGDLPMELIFPTTFFSISYWMAGLKPTLGNFFWGLIINLFNVLVSQGLGLALGATIMDQESAITIGTVIVMLFLLSSGYFVQHVPKYISWIKYLSITQYTYKLLLGSQYKPGETYPWGTNGTCLVKDFPSIKTLGLNGQAISLVALAAQFFEDQGPRFVANLDIGEIILQEVSRTGARTGAAVASVGICSVKL